MWASVRLRADTTQNSGPNSNGPVPGARVSHYNSAASINMAVWLAAIVWLINTLVSPLEVASLAHKYDRFRAFRPQYFLPSIVMSIFINVTGTYGTQFATMKNAESLGLNTSQTSMKMC